jgi:hypothetical protein
VRPRVGRERGKPSTTLHPATALDVLAARVAGLSICWTDPEHFHMEKHTLAAELRRLARDLRGAAA